MRGSIGKIVSVRLSTGFEFWIHRREMLNTESYPGTTYQLPPLHALCLSRSRDGGAAFESIKDVAPSTIVHYFLSMASKPGKFTVP